MSQIQETIHNIINYIEEFQKPFIEKLEKAEGREKEISTQLKNLSLEASEKSKLRFEEINIIFQKGLSKEDLDKEIQKIEEAHKSLSSRFDTLRTKLEQELEFTQELQDKICEDLDKNGEEIKKYIAKTYTNNIIKAIEIAKFKGEDPNPIYQKEGDFKGFALSHFISFGFFKEEGIKILSHLGPENIKRTSGFESAEFETESPKESELMIAIKQGDHAIINWFLENDKEVNHPKASGSTPLHMSSLVKDYDTTKMLLERGANPNVINKYGCTPLLDLIIFSYGFSLDEKLMVDFLKLFKQHGADFNLKNKSGYTIFEQYIVCDIPWGAIPCKTVKINKVKAVIEMLNSDQQVEINLDKPYVHKFFTDPDNLKELFNEDMSTTTKVAILCKIQKALLEFTTHKSYPAEKALKYFEDYIEETTQEGKTYHIAQTKEEYKSLTPDQLQDIIDKRAIDAAQILYDKIQNITGLADDATLISTMAALVNPQDVVCDGQDIPDDNDHGTQQITIELVGLELNEEV